MYQTGEFKGNDIIDGQIITDDEVKNHLNKKSCLKKELTRSLTDTFQHSFHALGTFCFCNNTDLCNKDNTSDAGSGNSLTVSTLVMAMLMEMLMIFYVV